MRTAVAHMYGGDAEGVDAVEITASPISSVAGLGELGARGTPRALRSPGPEVYGSGLPPPRIHHPGAGARLRDDAWQIRLCDRPLSQLGDEDCDDGAQQHEGGEDTSREHAECLAHHLRQRDTHFGRP